MNHRSAICIMTAWLVASSALAQVEYFEAENAVTLGTNYLSTADTNVPPFAFNSTFIRSIVNKTNPPSAIEPGKAIFQMGTLPTNTLYDLYLRVHVGPNTFNDDSIYLAYSGAGSFWGPFDTNVYNNLPYGFNGIAGLTGLDGAATTADGFHWVQTDVPPYDSFDGTNLWWACAPREDGLDLDAIAFIPSGWPVPDLTLNEILDPANAAVELWAGSYTPTNPVSVPSPLMTAYFVDGAGTANTNNITVTVNGGSVTNFTVGYANYATTVSFVPDVPFVTPSTNTVQVVAASSPGGTLVTNEFSVEVAGEPIVYVDASTNNTVMAVSTNGPVGAGTAWVVNTTDTVDGIWRFRATFGVPSSTTNEPSGTLTSLGGLYESTGNSVPSDNCPRVKTSVSVPTNSYDVYVYFWQDEVGSDWPIRAALEDTAGNNSLTLFNEANSAQVASDATGRELRRGYLGRVGDVTSIDVYVEDWPATNNNTRTWYDGIGYSVVPASELEAPVYVDLTTNNTVMAVSADGPVGAGTAWVVNTTDSVDGIWRFRATFGVDPSVTVEPSGVLETESLGGVYESTGNSGADNCPRLKTSVSVPMNTYDVYVYFWQGNVGSQQWPIRADLVDTPGTNSLTVFSDTNSVQIATEAGSTRVLRRGYLGRVEDVTSIDVYVEDLPAADNNSRTWCDGIGYEVAPPLSSIAYVDATTNNTVMAVSTNGPVGAGTTWVVNTTDTVDGIWRFRATFGVPSSTTNEPIGILTDLGGVFESTGNSSPSDNCPRLKTTVSGLPLNDYDVYVYFWQDEVGSPWPIRAGLADTPGTDSLTLFDEVGSLEIQSISVSSGNATLTWTEANSTLVAHDNAGPPGRELFRAYLGRVYNVTSFAVYVEDLPALANNTRTWYDGVGYAVASDAPRTYSIQHKTSITDAGWSNVKTNIAGVSLMTSDSVPVSGQSQEYFRVEGN